MMATADKTCGACGAPGQQGAFCDECGEPLPDAAPASTPASAPAGETAPAGESVPARESVPASESVRAGNEPARDRDVAETWDMLINRVAARRGSQSPGDRQDPAPDDQQNAPVPEPGTGPGTGPASGPVFRPAAGQPAADRTVIDQPVIAPDAADRNEQARALIVPVSRPAPARQAPEDAAPVLPGRPEPAMPSVERLQETEAFAGGPPCPWCGTPNPADRHFCRRCAMSLAARAAGPARRPWWRRLLDWRNREVPYAGQRPRLRRNPGQLTRWVVTLAVVGVVIGAAVAWGGSAVAGVEDHFAHPAVTFAASVTASSSDPHHPVANLHDGYNNTWWGTGQTGDGAGVHVDADFAQPVNLLDIVITPGAGVAQDEFTAQSRPQTINATLTSADGSSTSTTLTLTDSPGPQTFGVHGNDITAIRFTIQSAYLGPSGPHTEVAIAEIEFFARS